MGEDAALDTTSGVGRRTDLDEVGVPGVCGHAEVIVTLFLRRNGQKRVAR